MTKFKLFSALVANTQSRDCVLTINGVIGRCLGIEKEDGSGNKFNVKLGFLDGTNKTFFVKTID